MRENIIAFIDFFYPAFKRIFPIQTYRYAVCGGSNVLLDILLFYLAYHYVLHELPLDLGFVVIKAYNAALFMAFCITFPLGFVLSKYIVFQGSYLRSRVQLFRYCLVVGTNLVLNYVLLKVLVQYMSFYPTVAKISATVIIVTFSYLSQKHFTFRRPVED